MVILVKGTKMENNYNSGKSARIWRNSIINNDIKADKPVRTLQFPLEHKELSDEFIKNAKNTFLIVRGVGDGSLTKLLQVMLLCGFRICNNAATAKNISENVEGAIAWQNDTVVGSQNEISSIINSDSIMQSCYSHLKNLDDSFFNEIYSSGKILTDKKGDNTVLSIKERFVDGNASGLSRLFGEELKEWGKEKDEIKKYYNIPDEKDFIIDIVKGEINKIKKDEFYKKDSYSDFRKTVQGNIHSWVSNYDKRIESLIKFIQEIDSIFSEIDLSVCENNQQDLFKNLPIDYNELIQIFDSIKLTKADIESCLKIVNGNDDGDVEQSINSIVNFNEALIQLTGILNSLNENIKKYNENISDKKLKIKSIKNNKLKFDKIPKYTGSKIFETQQIMEFENELKNTLQLINEQFNCTKLDHKDAIDSQLSIFKNRWGDSSNGIDIDEKFVIANIFHRFISQLLKTDLGSIRHFVSYAYENKLITNKKDINKFLINNKGHFWKSPYARNRHESYKSLNFELLNQKNIFDVMCEYLDVLKNNIIIPKDYTNYLLMDYTYKNILLSTINNDIEKDKIKLPDQYNCNINIDPLINLIIKNNEIKSLKPDMFKKVFNTYGSKLKGLFFGINRKSFVDKITLRLAGDEYLYYVPKDKMWTIPNKTWKSDNKIKQSLNDIGYDNIAEVSTIDIFRKILDKKDLNDCHYHLLRQLPHDWCYCLASYNDGEYKHGVKIGKNAKLSNGFYNKKNQNLIRLIGASSYKNIIDDYLLKTSDGFSFGTMEVVLKLKYNQQVNYCKDDDNISITIDNNSDAKLSLNLPVNEVFKDNSNNFKNIKNCLAIDLGEYGIGYAVFNIENKKLIKSGTKTILAIRRVKTKANKYRNTQQNTNTFKSNYNNTMELVRKNAVGDVRNYINTLIEKYNAFPVFEHSVGNFESGGNQLKTIYQSILNYYCYSDIEAHKSLRSGYWNLKKSTETNINVYDNTLNADYTDVDNKDRQEKLKLHPGTQVSAAYTSQICSCCKKCVRLELKNNYNDTDKLLVKNGKIELSNGTIKLYKKPFNKGYSKELRKQSMNDKQGIDIKMRKQWTVPIDDQEIKVKDLYKILKSNMRRSNLSMQSKDTTQSRFFCPYTDCKNHQKKDKYGRINGVHADENAAKNIGERFLLRITTSE